jgi:hypothetical protein
MIKQLGQGRTGNFLFIFNPIATYDSLRAYLHWRNQIIKKIRILFKMFNRKWNGYYYFALSDM